MYKTMLMLHFVGLSIGAGTGIYLAALAAWAARHHDAASAGALMRGPGSAIANVGTIGLALMIVSGLAMIAIIGGTGQFGWVFWVKMALVTTIVAYIVTMKRLARQAQTRPSPQLGQRLKQLRPVGPVLGVATIALAVWAFH
jgi:amino acid transporter